MLVGSWLGIYTHGLQGRVLCYSVRREFQVRHNAPFSPLGVSSLLNIRTEEGEAGMSSILHSFVFHCTGMIREKKILERLL